MSATREIEVKLAFADPEEADRALLAVGMQLTTPRTFEDNILYDRDGTLTAEHRLLRLRRRGDRAWLTFKGEVPGGRDGRHHVRLEHESAVADPDAIARMLDALGYRPTYRYQKYRTLYASAGLEGCLDELPIGCYVELEGEPDAIDRTARALGRSPDDYILKSYRELHDAAGDMIFEDGR